MSLQRRSTLFRYAIASLLVKSSVEFVAPRATCWSGYYYLLIRPRHQHDERFAAESSNHHHHHQIKVTLQRRDGFQTYLPSSYSSSEDTTSSISQPPSSTTSGSSAVRSQRPLPTDSDKLQMISFYKFTPLANPEECRDTLFEKIQEIPGLCGSIYLAQEGINGQMAVPPHHLDELLEACSSSLSSLDLFVDEKPNLGDVVPISTPTFDKLIVRTRDYVLRDGIDSEIGRTLDWSDAGPELEADEWHEAVMNRGSDNKIKNKNNSMGALLDCRNLYESEEGTFRGATPLETDNFQDSWSQLDGMTKDLSKDEPVYIFCTGGIRCVKVGAYLKQHLGFDNVKRLKNGIIGYQKWAEENPGEPSAWEGENFLFDKRWSENKGEVNEETIEKE
ncbi:unnamed protein product [Cylindrotheca closterium]|uniref:Rhodanese domain-containing protein n=1 Tax=Cylindrotheca closterium TaxID=2856 RepID=A0AAD2G750_9STRA|nr:unnamed protein product [Cylindrotheca closterium]